jgi:hypothetical protein|tara:strand:- start:313 stop:519 length:207 start_codon:yes stop_codon:yes gene_type:complete
MVTIELNISEEILNDMITEQEMRYSSCFVRKDELIDDVSQEFLTTILRDYKNNKPIKHLLIKIKKSYE